MFQRLYDGLRAARVPVTLREYLVLIDAVQRGAIEPRVDDFYHLARAALVKDERHIDRFDRVFGEVYRGLGDGGGATELPEEWLRSLAARVLTDAERAQVEAMGGWDQLMEALRQRLAEQRGRHEGGSKWIGTGGTSPFGNDGYNPEGVRIGQARGRHGRAVKVWDRREFRNLDDHVELGTRNIKLALRRLRRFAREGTPGEFDLDGTIRETARHGYLDIRMRPERRNAVKLLLLLDVGGSMDPYVRSCEELFSAARSEFAHLEHYYFHNCPYERVWRDNRRRHGGETATLDLLRRHGRDWRVVVVGDASMSPYEITEPGGSIEHMNAEPGATWLARLAQHFERLAWLNPTPAMAWATPSVRIVRELIGPARMYELTLAGIDGAMRELATARGTRQ